ncbi:transmembrane protein 45b [Plakobranchus ocellatus]|uniref:Transmembrane protein 45b n=1 Tax=Plakobranchus ocellatus TaxID=259542 RepID=A0AAV4A4M9_9GAST|nr:transmembrane protein 45b [Plakobranchus ocellatus]
MGSFWGHVDEGIFFVLIALWWMVCAFKEYILAESKGQSVRPNIHYSVTLGRPLPLEIFFKILFPTVGELLDGGVRFQDSEGNFVKLIYQQHMTIYGIFVIHSVTDLMAWLRAPLFPSFLGELLDGGVRFQDSEGNFVKLVYQQHMTIYGIFVIHSVTDLMAWFRAPLFPMFNYLTAVLAFLWYGVAFYYHASMHGKEPVEKIVHILPIFVMFLVSLASKCSLTIFVMFLVSLTI